MRIGTLKRVSFQNIVTWTKIESFLGLNSLKFTQPNGLGSHSTEKQLFRTFCGLATVLGFTTSIDFFGRKMSFLGTGTVGSRTSAASVSAAAADVGDVGVRGLKDFSL